MRKIEERMCGAVANCLTWEMDNTSVKPTMHNCMGVYLWGNHVADVTASGKVLVNFATYSKWPTRTTKSRINALTTYFKGAK
jgi:hypothetical protein